MKKIFTLMAAMLAVTGMFAEEKTVWEGNEAISWNTEVAPGTQFETPEGTFTGLKVDNIIRIYTTTTYEEPNYVVTYKKGSGWEWTDLTITVADGVLSYTVETEDVATEIAERGLILRGQCYSITKITVDAEAETPVVGEQTVWEGNEAISWNTEVAPGTQFETPAGTFTGLASGNTIKAYTTTTYEEPQYVMTYKKGDGWDWTDLAVTVEDGVMSYQVADAITAFEIADRGLIFRGQAYNLVKITITKTDATGISTTQRETSADNRCYTLQGQQVTAGYKGIVIRNGKKFVVR